MPTEHKSEEKTTEQRLEEAEKLVGHLHHQIKSLVSELDNLKRYAKTLEADNVDLRNKILRVERIRFGQDRVCFEIDVQQFMMWDGKARDEYVTEAVMDAVRMILHHASRTEHLKTLRNKSAHA